MYLDRRLVHGVPGPGSFTSPHILSIKEMKLLEAEYLVRFTRREGNAYYYRRRDQHEQERTISR